MVNPPANAGDLGSIPVSGRCPGEGNGNPLQYSCLENPTDKGAWPVTVHGITTQLNNDSLSAYLSLKGVGHVVLLSPQTTLAHSLTLP